MRLVVDFRYLRHFCVSPTTLAFQLINTLKLKLFILTKPQYRDYSWCLRSERLKCLLYPPLIGPFCPIPPLVHQPQSPGLRCLLNFLLNCPLNCPLNCLPNCLPNCLLNCPPPMPSLNPNPSPFLRTFLQCHYLHKPNTIRLMPCILLLKHLQGLMVTLLPKGVVGRRLVVEQRLSLIAIAMRQVTRSIRIVCVNSIQILVQMAVNSL